MGKKAIDKITYDNFLKSVPTIVADTKNLISAYGSIDVEDLKNAIDRFNKVPDYGDLLKENKKQKEIIDKLSKIIFEIKDSIEITGGYPSNYIDDLLKILEDEEGYDEK